MQKELIALNGHMVIALNCVFTILCITFSIFNQPLLSLEISTLQKCYLCENWINRKEVSKITATGIDTIRICTQN